MMADGHALVRQFGLTWIGKNFVPWNTAPPVMEIGYEPETSIERINAMKLEPEATYVLSAESLEGAHTVLAALHDRFLIDLCVMTFRFPAFLSISDYCFRGWISHSLDDYIASTPGNIMSKSKRCAAVIANVRRKLNTKALLCPVEADDVERRFFLRAFGRAPANLDDLAARNRVRNKSVSPSMAVLLHQELKAEGGTISVERRRAFARAASDLAQVDQLEPYLPAQLIGLFSDRAWIEEEITAYRKMLEGGGCETSVIDDSVRAVRNRIDTLSRKSAPPSEIVETTRERAREILTGAQKL